MERIITLLSDTTFLQVIDILGTLAFAISGIRLASAKHFDFFGAYVIGLTTAVGGGTLRDLMLGVPPFWLLTPSYLICTGIALLWVVAFGKRIIKQNNTWYLFDTIGIALFTVVGTEKTIAHEFPLWSAIVMGAVTGAAGGMLRDVFINEVPLIFRKEIYALACVLGGVAYVTCYSLGASTPVSGIVCSAVVISARMLSVKYKIHLPTLKGEDAQS